MFPLTVKSHFMLIRQLEVLNCELLISRGLKVATVNISWTTVNWAIDIYQVSSGLDLICSDILMNFIWAVSLILFKSTTI